MLASRISRRGFIQASAFVGGGLLVGVAVPSVSRAAAETSLNAYVRVDTNGRVTVIMPKVEMGQGTYTSLPMLVAEELDVGLDSIDVEAAPPDPKVYGFDGDQSTGGSTTIRLCYLPLRKAGAAARVMLVGAAAKKWGVSADGCRTERGEVIHDASNRRLGYGALATLAATMAAPADPPLKAAKNFKVIGHSQLRRDAPAKVNGSAVFGIDIQQPGQKIAVVVMSPVQGGTVAEPLRTAAALAVPGVRQVVNERDLVAVVADHTWAAMKGIQALQLQWNPCSNCAVQQSQLVADLEAATHRPGAVAAHAGDASGVMAKAAKQLEAVYHQPFLAHATMEPMNCTVHWRKDLCEIWTGTQAPDRAVDKLAALGLKPEQIKIHNQLIGGGFGRRLEVDGVVIAARIARHVDSPVKVLWTREQDMQHDNYRPYYVDRIAAGLDAGGKPVAWRHTIAGSAVTALYSGEPLKNGIDDDVVECSANLAYAVPNLEVRYVRQEPPGVSTSWWRGVGPTRSIFVVESFIDECAAAAHQDPVAYRRGLIKDPRLKGVLELAVAKAGWGTPLPAGHGRGISLQSAFGSYMANVTEVAIGKGGKMRVVRVVCALDCGQLVNPDTVHAQMQGGVMFGLSAALFNEITIDGGRVQQNNFYDFRALRMTEAPRMETYIVPSTESPGGVGETGTACAAAALCNAIFAANGTRIRTLPVGRQMVV